MFSIYDLKPRFQNLLRPLTRFLFNHGATANMVTLSACAISIFIGSFLLFLKTPSLVLFILIPIWMFLRMAFNAIDGMLAREFDQKSSLGAYYNELTDVVSDCALYLPFAFLSSSPNYAVFAFIFLSALSEMTGLIGPLVGSHRSYKGPMGKSDRAFFIGALGLYLSFGFPHSSFGLFLFFSFLSCGVVLSIVNRIRDGVSAS